MNRSGYTEEGDNWSEVRWRGAVKSALRGKRGQAFLRELADALDAMPDKRLIDGAAHRDGAYCALGVLGAKRGVDLDRLNRLMDDETLDEVADAFQIPMALACEIMYTNDWCPILLHWSQETADRRRWHRVREWVGEVLT